MAAGAASSTKDVTAGAFTSNKCHNQIMCSMTSVPKQCAILEVSNNEDKELTVYVECPTPVQSVVERVPETEYGGCESLSSFVSCCVLFNSRSCSLFSHCCQCLQIDMTSAGIVWNSCFCVRFCTKRDDIEAIDTALALLASCAVVRGSRF